MSVSNYSVLEARKGTMWPKGKDSNERLLLAVTKRINYMAAKHVGKMNQILLCD